MISNGRVTLFFPAGALDADTEISMQMMSDGTLGVNFEPHGIQFHKPVIMQMDLRGTTAEGQAASTSTVWDNVDAHRYERMPSLIPVDENTSRSELRHFSEYMGVGG